MIPRDSRLNPIAGDELSRYGFGYRVVRVREVNPRFRAVEYIRTDQLYPCVQIVSLTTWRKMMKGATRKRGLLSNEQ